MSDLQAVVTKFEGAYRTQIDQVLQALPAIEEVTDKGIYPFELAAFLRPLRSLDSQTRTPERISRGGYQWDEAIDFDHQPHIDLYTDGNSALAWLSTSYLAPLKTLTAELYARQAQQETLTEKEQTALKGYEALCGLAQSWQQTGDLQQLSDTINSHIDEHAFTHFKTSIKPASSHVEAAAESRKASGERGVV